MFPQQAQLDLSGRTPGQTEEEVWLPAVGRTSSVQEPVPTETRARAPTPIEFFIRIDVAPPVRLGEEDEEEDEEDEEEIEDDEYEDDEDVEDDEDLEDDYDDDEDWDDEDWDDEDSDSDWDG